MSSISSTDCDFIPAFKSSNPRNFYNSQYFVTEEHPFSQLHIPRNIRVYTSTEDKLITDYNLRCCTFVGFINAVMMKYLWLGKSI
jgi:hypothetical protein